MICSRSSRRSSSSSSDRGCRRRDSSPDRPACPCLCQASYRPHVEISSSSKSRSLHCPCSSRRQGRARGPHQRAAAPRPAAARRCGLCGLDWPSEEASARSSHRHPDEGRRRRRGEKRAQEQHRAAVSRLSSCSHCLDIRHRWKPRQRWEVESLRQARSRRRANHGWRSRRRSRCTRPLRVCPPKPWRPRVPPQEASSRRRLPCPVRRISCCESLQRRTSSDSAGPKWPNTWPTSRRQFWRRPLPLITRPGCCEPYTNASGRVRSSATFPCLNKCGRQERNAKWRGRQGVAKEVRVAGPEPRPSSNDAERAAGRPKRPDEAR